MGCSVNYVNSVIQDQLKVDRQGSYHHVKENDEGATNRLLKIGGATSVCFSLDDSTKDYLPFFKTVKDIKSKCDGLLVATKDGQEVIVSIELKSSRRGKGKAFQQVRKGLVFLEWLMRHGMECKKCNTSQKKAVIINYGSPQPKKMATTLTALPSPTKEGDVYIFELYSHDVVKLGSLFEHIK